MTEPREGQTGTQLKSGLVLIAGGSEQSTQYLATAELFNPATGTFRATSGDLVTARIDNTATLLRDGRVLLTGGEGGYDDPPQLSSAEVYNP
jgi:hypothetical protein